MENMKYAKYLYATNSVEEEEKDEGNALWVELWKWESEDQEEILKNSFRVIFEFQKEDLKEERSLENTFMSIIPK